MAAIPTEWVEKLFTCMAQFYGERWTKPLEKKHMADFHKTIWQNGLSGLTYDQIKAQLIKCKKHAEDGDALPPMVVDFYLHAKNIIPPLKTIKNPMRNNEVAKQHLTEIKQKLAMTT